MRLSRYFIPILKDDPKEAEIISHKLMLRAGMIRQESSGIYSWLPLGLRVLKKVENIVREEQNKAGALEILMPTVQSADLWKKSGRYHEYGKEMLRFKDRHMRDMLYGPTNEEMITDIFRTAVQSYRDLPRNLYHIQWKFRDEIRPRFGVMRGREFLMKDAYSFDLTEQEGHHSYNVMFLSYLRTYQRMGLTAIPMRADSGPIGGNMSHEFLILAETGESQVYFDRNYLSMDWQNTNVAYDDTEKVQNLIDQFTTLYAVSDEEYDENTFNAHVPKKRQVTGRGVEVGHVFFFGDKYAKPLNCLVQDKAGKPTYVHSGSYGIGISRLVGAIIEASHDQNGIIWPETVAPFHIALLNLSPEDHDNNQFCNTLYQTLSRNGYDVLYDDTTNRAGTKFATADLIGIPIQILVGNKERKNGHIQLKKRKNKEKQTIPHDKLIDILQNDIL